MNQVHFLFHDYFSQRVDVIRLTRLIITWQYNLWPNFFWESRILTHIQTIWWVLFGILIKDLFARRALSWLGQLNPGPMDWHMALDHDGFHKLLVAFVFQCSLRQNVILDFDILAHFRVQQVEDVCLFLRVWKIIRIASLQLIILRDNHVLANRVELSFD